jgi:HTH-type transcriptional regulator/antitoxin MqsA
MTFDKRNDRLSYQGHDRTRKTLGWWCDSCDEAIFDGAALAERERDFLELKAEVDNVLGPAQVAEVREKLGLSQRQAGELLGGGPRAFQKYEAGTQAVSRPMSHLLRLLAKDPKRLEELRRATRTASLEIRRSREKRVSGSKRSGKKSAVA